MYERSKYEARMIIFTGHFLFRDLMTIFCLHRTISTTVIVNVLSTCLGRILQCTEIFLFLVVLHGRVLVLQGW